MGKKQNIPDQLQSIARSAPPSRVTYYFDVPERLAEQIGVAQIGLYELTTGEELMATKRANGDPIQLAFQMAKESVRFVDGVGINTGDGTADTFWGSNKSGMFAFRQMVIAAFGSIHAPQNDEVASFLASRKTSVG